MNGNGWNQSADKAKVEVQTLSLRVLSNGTSSSSSSNNNNNHHHNIVQLNGHKNTPDSSGSNATTEESTNTTAYSHSSTSSSSGDTTDNTATTTEASSSSLICSKERYSEISHLSSLGTTVTSLSSGSSGCLNVNTSAFTDEDPDPDNSVFQPAASSSSNSSKVTETETESNSSALHDSDNTLDSTYLVSSTPLVINSRQIRSQEQQQSSTNTNVLQSLPLGVSSTILQPAYPTLSSQQKIDNCSNMKMSTINEDKNINNHNQGQSEVNQTFLVPNVPIQKLTIVKSSTNCNNNNNNVYDARIPSIEGLNVTFTVEPTTQKNTTTTSFTNSNNRIVLPSPTTTTTTTITAINVEDEKQVNDVAQGEESNTKDNIVENLLNIEAKDDDDVVVVEEEKKVEEIPAVQESKNNDSPAAALKNIKVDDSMSINTNNNNKESSPATCFPDIETSKLTDTLVAISSPATLDTSGDASLLFASSGLNMTKQRKPKKHYAPGPIPSNLLDSKRLVSCNPANVEKEKNKRLPATISDTSSDEDDIPSCTNPNKETNPNDNDGGSSCQKLSQQKSRPKAKIYKGKPKSQNLKRGRESKADREALFETENPRPSTSFALQREMRRNQAKQSAKIKRKGTVAVNVSNKKSRTIPHEVNVNSSGGSSIIDSSNSSSRGGRKVIRKRKISPKLFSSTPNSKKKNNNENGLDEKEQGGEEVVKKKRRKQVEKPLKAKVPPPSKSKSQPQPTQNDDDDESKNEASGTKSIETLEIDEKLLNGAIEKSKVEKPTPIDVDNPVDQVQSLVVVSAAAETDKDKQDEADEPVQESEPITLKKGVLKGILKKSNSKVSKKTMKVQQEELEEGAGKGEEENAVTDASGENINSKPKGRNKKPNIKPSTRKTRKEVQQEAEEVMPKPNETKTNSRSRRFESHNGNSTQVLEILQLAEDPTALRRSGRVRKVRDLGEGFLKL